MHVNNAILGINVVNGAVGTVVPVITGCCMIILIPRITIAVHLLDNCQVLDSGQLVLRILLTWETHSLVLWLFQQIIQILRRP